PPGKSYVAWLVADSDTQYIKLGELTVQGNGSVLLTYKDGGGNNLLLTSKKFLVSQETSPFSGNKPTLSAVVFADSLHGIGQPTSGSPLTRIRNCLATFSNTAQNHGLAIWMLNDYIAHAGFARSDAVGNNPGGAKTHSDHVYDFIQGKLINAIDGSIAANGDPVGYGFRRYGDLGTKDSSQGGAGYLGGAGYHVKLAIGHASATEQMKKAGGSAVVALTNAFGANNDSGLAKQVTDQVVKIINGAYTSLSTEGLAFEILATRFINGTIGAADTASATGGIRQAYYHMQRMATFVLKTPVSKVQLSKSLLNFGSIASGTSKTDSVTVRNPGNNLLVVDSIRVSGQWYSVQQPTASVQPGDSVRIRVTFAPSVLGSHPGFVILYNNSPSSRDTVTLQGTAGTTFVIEHEPTGQVPETYILNQNYPNPFNASTEIGFHVPARSRVWITIHNVLGREIARLIEGQDFDAGSYRMRWQSAEAASGVYYCRILASAADVRRSFSATNVMILLK
ncbi:MAG: Por secretion system C-terminal sorting domain-containing protein, partial [Bacteroidetes bacterium]|nr:Por secretion system C-terminal sorting domain-containing protein [Bacteroidota bacterium]